MDRELAKARRHDSSGPTWISARLRAGDIVLADVELLSYLGHHGALALVGSKAKRGDLFSWIRGLRAWHESRGPEAAVRAVLAAACELLEARPLRGERPERPFRERLARSIARVEYALASPQTQELPAAFSDSNDPVTPGLQATAERASLGSVEVFIHLLDRRKRSIYRAAGKTLESWQRSFRLPREPRGLIRDALTAWILSA